MSATETIKDPILDTVHDFLTQYSKKHGDNAAIQLDFLMKSQSFTMIMAQMLRQSNAPKELFNAVGEATERYVNMALNITGDALKLQDKEIDAIEDAAQHIFAQLHKIEANLKAA